MSENIKRMLAEREKAAEAHAAALRREINRRIVETAKAKFTAAFQRQVRFHRARTNPAFLPLPLETLATCEGAELAADPGWDAERAWTYSETRARAVAEADAELDRRLSGVAPR
jgi:hypothetical protein